jgi:transposase
MNQVIIVGCDLHDRSLLLKAARGMDAPQQKSFLNDCDGRQAMLDYLLGFALQHEANRIVFVYEASGQGYGLYDFLTDQGIECYVLSPSHLPKSAKQKRNKTDAKDAQMLLETARAYVMAGNDLPIVWVPPKALRDDRELVRARLETAEAGACVKLKILSLLKRHSRAIPEAFRSKPNWTKRFLRYLATEAQQLPSVVGPVLLSLLARLEVIRQQVTELDRQLRKLSTTERYRVPCETLRKIKGVGLLTALTFLTELGDLNRFPNRRTIGAYLGLTPAAKESGEASDRKGHITRQGGGRLRKMLCQAAWAAIRSDAAVRTAWQRIRGNRPGRGKKALVAIMRRLGIRMWHLALAAGVSSDMATRPIPPPCWLAAASTHLGQAT